MAIISAMEFLKTAVEIEEKNRVFYVHLAEASKNLVWKETFLLLASEEEKHREFVTGIIGNIDRYITMNININAVNPETVKDLVSYAGRIIFTKEELKDKLSAMNNAVSILDMAISLEQKSILFYTEIQDMIQIEDSHLLDKLIQEERGHILKLEQLKKVGKGKI